jgi:hypothetical protein
VKPAERDAFISEKLDGLIEQVRAGRAPAKDRYKNERAVLERLIPIPTDGFRGITLTAIMGKMVREDINTSNEFGSINPRSVFEKGIRPVLKKHRIPTGASPPLNVAKNVQVIDEKWAEGRKPEDAALAAVDYIRRINRHWDNDALRLDLIFMFIERLVEFSDEVGALDVGFEPSSDDAPISIAIKLSSFAVEFPEGGAVPQFLVGKILEALRSEDAAFASVEGADSSVFGTNTTSNKPSDVWDILSGGTLGNLYEVTCKKVDLDRLDAAVESLARLAAGNLPITFVCRLPEDVESLAVELGAVHHRGVKFQFIDIRQLIEIGFFLLTPPKRMWVIEQVSKFVADPSRRTKTKRGWAGVFHP